MEVVLGLVAAGFVVSGLSNANNSSGGGKTPVVSDPRTQAEAQPGSYRPPAEVYSGGWAPPTYRSVLRDYNPHNQIEAAFYTYPLRDYSTYPPAVHNFFTPTTYQNNNVYDQFHVAPDKLEALRQVRKGQEERFVPLSMERASAYNPDRYRRRMPFFNHPDGVFSEVSGIYVPNTATQVSVLQQ